MAWLLPGEWMMKPRFPELRLGPDIRRNHLTIYPLFPAQRLLFPDALPGPAFAVATYHQRAMVKAIGERQARRATPNIANNTNGSVLFLQGDYLDNKHALTTAILIPPVLCGCHRFAAARFVWRVEAIEFRSRLVLSAGSSLAVNFGCTFSATRRPHVRPHGESGTLVLPPAQPPREAMWKRLRV